MNSDAQSSSAAAAEPQRLLTLRVDVQNAGALPLAPTTFTMNAPASIEQFHTLLQSKLVDSIAQADESSGAALAAEHAQMKIDVEIYDARKDQFLSLQSLAQLSQKRARLNVIIHRNDGVPQQNCLALPSKMFDSSEFTIQGVAVSVGEVGNSGQGTGLTTWDGSVVLAKYLEHARMEDIRGRRIVEVGSGTGLVGLSAALLGAREVTLTDLEYTMDNLSRNVATTMRNAAAITNTSIDCQVHTQVLDWFEPPTNLGSFDFILASDVVWVEELIPPLVLTFDVLLQNSKERDTKILMSYQKRSIVSDQLLFSELEKRALVKRKIPASALHPQFASERIDVWEIARRRGGQG